MGQSQKVLVAGTGLSGLSAARLLLDMGGEVVLYDSKPRLNPEALKKELEEEKRVSVVLGELRRADLRGVEMCIISPGISLEAPFVGVLDEAKIPIWSEIQLAYQCAKGRLAAITGTNGKTTTTALVGEIMKAFYKDVYVVGNIGTPYTQVALRTEDQSVTVAEVSSFQLETIMNFRPDVSAILNITPDHLDRHHTMECYIAVKEQIAVNQTEKDICVLNYDDEILRNFGQQTDFKPKTVFFSSSQKLNEGYYLDKGMIVSSQDGKITPIVNVKELNLLGKHNYENVMAAVAVSEAMGVSLPVIQRVVKKFKAVEHRIEFVLERSGVRYYNDSKGTNPDAAIQAIKAMPGPILLIAGGYDKHSDYDEWIEAFDGKVKYLVLIGQTRDKISECAKAHGFYDIMYAEDMFEAVHVCASYANMGDYVLLSPACASWGMFKNYEERGRIFKECVRNL